MRISVMGNHSHYYNVHYKDYCEWSELISLCSLVVIQPYMYSIFSGCRATNRYMLQYLCMYMYMYVAIQMKNMA